MTPKKKVSSGISGLNRMINSLFIGDNVVWYDDAGSLASEFCTRFIQESQQQNKPIVYVSFDRSPKNLIEKLGPLAENQQLTILDCFTNGKGDKARIFNKFYEKDGAQWPYQVIKVTRPELPQAVSDAIYGLHKTLSGDVRFVVESLTGMADLWDGEDHILKFYSHTCPQLYELDTIAYWIIEKGAHSHKLKAHINQVAQVAIDLSIQEGKTRIKLLKAENRSPKALGKSLYYTFQGDNFMLEGNQQPSPLYDLGSAIKAFRKTQGMSQKELSRLVGVTPSNISQIESNQVFPSIPALYKISNHLSVAVGSFFQEKTPLEKTIFRGSDAIKIHDPNWDKKSMDITQLNPFDLGGKADLFLVTIFPGGKLSTHFFQHKGEEIGHILSGEVDMVFQDQTHHLKPNDTVYLKTTPPTQWHNRHKEMTKILWIKVK
ncbi:helix-turn-helix domain-containing protein [Desulfobacula sp.]|uniref:helix-turn-helix domain-containing protein n=1 Tax=Desulfobacula sp. TaxID=2593537 RepID=UPI002623E75D|nr:helix-turn-helix domain-containing protein [Desulfobacula sp.]